MKEIKNTSTKIRIGSNKLKVTIAYFDTHTIKFITAFNIYKYNMGDTIFTCSTMYIKTSNLPTAMKVSG